MLLLVRQELAHCLLHTSNGELQSKSLRPTLSFQGFAFSEAHFGGGYLSAGQS